jgi:hypothetical protein
MASRRKLVLLGAGSYYFHTVIGELLVTPEIAGSEIVLYDINKRRMETTYGIGKRLLEKAKAGWAIRKATSLPRALDGADFAIGSVGVHRPFHQNTEIALWHKLDCDVANRDLNSGMAAAATMLTRIHEGETEFIPVLERGLELARMSPHTGMFHGPKGNHSGRAWSGYGTTANTMKGLARMLGYMGVENMPYRHTRADTLIKNQEQCRKGEISMRRNTA